ncbi:MAG TPA: PP2C family protein-serine/threonine phosphatase [Terriglobales bacterium]|nr:PP2C family protein-serine/threonine phosphatase [Terriglobales bacterium]
MGPPQIESAAFHQAQLQSERLRILGVLSFAAVLAVVTVLRVFVIRTASVGTPWVWNVVLACTIAVYELCILRRVDLALKGGQSVPSRYWVISTLLETSIPAFAIAFLASPQIQDVYRPLATPAVLAFFIFIILSTLRLDLWICWLSGVVATLAYVAAALYLGWRPPVLGIPSPVTQTYVGLNALTLLFGGAIAGAVARQIRKHVDAALREAETKRRLEAIQHDLQVARSIQQSLLPKERPPITGFDIAGWNEPAEDTGGDYFDWMTLDDGKFVATLGDVTGHGIGPALLAAACRAYSRASFRAGHDLSTTLGHINQALQHDLTPERFVTFVAAVCAPDGAEAEILSAGHGPLLVYSRSSDRFTELEAQAVPFGILPFFNSDPPARLRLNPGDLLLLITDGFCEWENERGEDFGVQRAEEVIRASRDLSSAEIIAKLYDAVITFANGTSQKDDLTAVLIKRL